MKLTTPKQPCGVCNRPGGVDFVLPSGLAFVVCALCQADRWMVAAAEEKARRK